MPCSVSREEEIAYELADNLRRFGSSDLTTRINETVACELARAYKTFVSTGRVAPLSEMTKKWVAHHEHVDRQREEEKKKKQQQTELKQSALSKLTNAERKALLGK